MSDQGVPPGAISGALPPGLLEQPTAGAEAVAQSGVAKQGLAAWQAAQALPPGQRPEFDMIKAIMMYVMTEGPDAPQAREMIAWLQSKGFQVPGITQQPGMEDEDESAPTKKDPGPTVTAASEPPATVRPGGPKPSGPKKY